MNAILKHTFRSAGSNKAQSAIIILTIIAVTAMVFISFSLSDIFFNIQMSVNDRVAQGADMLLGSNSGGGETFSRSRAELLLSKNPADIEYAEYFLKLPTVVKTDKVSKTVLVEATDLQDYVARHKINYVKRYDGNADGPSYPGSDVAVEYHGAIIGENFANEAGIEPGDTVEIYLATYDIYSKLTILYIAENEGIFGGATDRFILTDFSAVGYMRQVNAVYIKFTDPALFDSYQKMFEEYLPGVDCGEGNSFTAVKNIVNNNTMLLAVALIFVIATVMLIQLTAYLIIARNRMSEMVIFKAAGATPMQVTAIMLAEVLLYCVIGISIGLAAGRLIMTIISKTLLAGARGALTYQVWKYIATAASAVAVTVLACLSPAVGVAKKTIRDMYSSGSKEAAKGKPVLFGAATALLIACAVTVNFVSGVGVIVLSGILTVIIAVWLSFAIPFVVKFTAWLLSKIKKSGPFYLSALSIKRNRAMRTVTVLVAVVIAFSFMATSLVSLVKTAVTPFRSRYDADYIVNVQDNLDEERYEEMRKTIAGLDGIGYAGYYNGAEFIEPFQKEKYFTLYGVSDYETLKRSSKGLSEDAEENWNVYENPVILNEDLMLRFGYKIGDTVTFVIHSVDFKDREFTFTVAGIDETLTEYDKVGYVRFSALAEVTKTASFLIAADNASVIDEFNDEVFLNVRETVETLTLNGKRLQKSFALTYDEWVYGGAKTLEGVKDLLTLLQIAVYLISILGIINISIVTVYDRKRELLIYRVAGMSETDSVPYASGEAVNTALSGGILGIAVSYVINLLLPIMGTLIEKYIDFGAFPLTSLLTALIGGVIFMLIWTAIAFFKRRLRLASINERLN